MSSRARISIVVVAVIALAVAFVVARGSDDDGGDRADNPPVTAAPADTTSPSTGGTTAPQTTTADAAPAAPAVPVIRVVGGQPQGGVRRLSFDKGDQIRFRVRSDVADEIHVHGYDLAKDVPAGGSVTFSFPGAIDGRFEVELEHRGVQIAELEVQP